VDFRHPLGPVKKFGEKKEHIQTRGGGVEHLEDNVGKSQKSLKTVNNKSHVTLHKRLILQSPPPDLILAKAPLKRNCHHLGGALSGWFSVGSGRSLSLFASAEQSLARGWNHYNTEVGEITTAGSERHAMHTPKLDLTLGPREK